MLPASERQALRGFTLLVHMYRRTSCCHDSSRATNGSSYNNMCVVGAHNWLTGSPLASQTHTHTRNRMPRAALHTLFSRKECGRRQRRPALCWLRNDMQTKQLRFRQRPPPHGRALRTRLSRMAKSCTNTRAGRKRPQCLEKVPPFAHGTAEERAGEPSRTADCTLPPPCNRHACLIAFIVRPSKASSVRRHTEQHRTRSSSKAQSTRCADAPLLEAVNTWRPAGRAGGQSKRRRAYSNFQTQSARHINTRTGSGTAAPSSLTDAPCIR